MMRRRWATVLAAGVVATLVLVGLAAPWLAPHDPVLVDLNHRLQPPVLGYPLGTDQFGRCIFSRLLYGARATLGSAFATLLVTLAAAGIVATATTFAPPRVRRVCVRLLELAQALPTLVVAVAVVGVLGPGLVNAMVAVAITSWAAPARVLRALLLGEQQAMHVAAARAVGASPVRVLFRHVLPGVVGRAAVLFATYLGQIMLTFSALSFLGLGPQPPLPEWGAMLSEGRPYFWTQPSLMLIPGLAIVLAVAATNVVADGLRDAFDDRRSR
jgi:ABC-type dipeptide/oligopeptide/nickel transport system permease subunit